MNKENLAYLAGFIDGEGSIYISKGKKLNYGHQYFLCVSANNTSRIVIDAIASEFGGTVSKNSDSRRNRRDLYRVRIYSNQAVAFLEAIIPFLRMKSRQAAIAIEFQKSGAARQLTEKEKEKYKSAIGEINQKGRKE